VLNPSSESGSENRRYNSLLLFPSLLIPQGKSIAGERGKQAA